METVPWGESQWAAAACWAAGSLRSWAQEPCGVDAWYQAGTGAWTLAGGGQCWSSGSRPRVRQTHRGSGVSLWKWGCQNTNWGWWWGKLLVFFFFLHYIQRLNVKNFKRKPHFKLFAGFTVIHTKLLFSWQMSFLAYFEKTTWLIYN